MKGTKAIVNLFVLLAIFAVFSFALNSTVALLGLLFCAVFIFVLTITTGSARSERIRMEWDPKNGRVIPMRTAPPPSPSPPKTETAFKATSSRMRTGT